jgi:hypothetical protein
MDVGMTLGIRNYPARPEPLQQIYQRHVDDAVYGEQRHHFSEDQLVALGLHCALCVGLGRLAATWHVVDDLPDEFRVDSDTPLAPWNASSVVASG